MSEKSVAKSTAVMSVATLISRFTGLVRTWAMAFALGNTVITSAYQIANNMPNALYDLVAGGILAAAFIPIFMLEKERAGEQGGADFANNMLNIVIVLLGGLSLLASIFAPAVIATQTFTVGEQDVVTQYAIDLFRIFAFQILFYGIGSIFTGILNANREFFLPALAPALNNVCCIISFFAYVPLYGVDPQLALVVLGVGVTVGVAVQFLVQIPSLAKINFKYRFYINLKDPALKEALRIAVPTVIYIAGTLVALTCRNAFSLNAGEDGPSALGYAWIWFQLPYGVVAVSLSSALFTEMSEAAARNDTRTLREHVRTGISNTLLLIVPLAGLLCVLSVPTMSLFQAGAFNSDDVYDIALLLSAWVISLPAYSVVMFLYRTYASLRQFMFFALLSVGLEVVECVLYGVLCSIPQVGLLGVPLAELFYTMAMAVVLMIHLRGRIGDFGIRGIVSSGARVLLATVVGCVVVWALQELLVEGEGMLYGFLSLVGYGLVGLVIIFVLCAVLKVPEMSFLVGLKDRFLKR
ncbi:MAG: murein biosynthesis integral membrane protein MurJ [Coriobacteriia bacterium]|nr:murein biosynthesis integral membrane protein MurJ [Coriobacteriia bacterium]